MRVVSRVLVAWILLAAGTAYAQGDITKVLVKKADKLYAQRGSGKAVEAVGAYEKVLAVDGKNVEARWKIARSYYWIGQHVNGEDKKLAEFEKGIRYAQEAIKLDPNCAPCHYWLGVCYGKFGETKGVLQSLGLVPHVKDAMNKVIQLNPKFYHGGPYRVLGRLYFKLPSFKGGDPKKAIENLKKATEIGPKNLTNRNFLVEVLLAEGRKEEAKKELEFAINLPEAEYPPELAPENREEKKIAEATYKKHFGGK